MNPRKILKWHEETRRDPGHHVGIFVPLPEEIAQQFPAEGKEGEDSSPPHVTVLYVGDLKDSEKQEEFVDVVKKTASALAPFEVDLGNVEEFSNEGQRVTHSPVRGKDLHKLHNVFKGVLKLMGIPFSDKHPEYKPHVTIEYVNEGDDEKFSHLIPQGNWIIDHLWVWGTEKPHMVRLGD